jgi:hypothetical protein
VWKAVRVAKDANDNEVEITRGVLVKKFAELFDNTIKNVLSNTSVDENIYIGRTMN